MGTGLQALPMMFHPKTGDVVVAHNLPAGEDRWTPARKCLVIEGISKGLISEEDALAKYGFSKDELLKMRALYEQFGLSGLSVGKMEMNVSTGHLTPQEGAVPGVIEVQDVILDREAGTVHVSRRHVHCTPQQLLVLELLMLNAGRVVAYDELMAYLYDVRQRKRASREILRVLVCSLQKNLRGYGDHTYIDTVWGRGYRLKDA
jgi:DNA-binding response OmpR family regulator